MSTEPLEIVCPKELETEIKSLFSILTQPNADNIKKENDEQSTEVTDDQGISPSS